MPPSSTRTLLTKHPSNAHSVRSAREADGHAAVGRGRGAERPGSREQTGERRDPSRGRLAARMTTVLRDALPLAILAIAMVGAPVLIFEPHGLPRLRSLERDLEQVEAENRAMERDIGRMRVQVRMLKDDLSAVEKVARTELGLVRKSEIVFQLPRPSP